MDSKKCTKCAILKNLAGFSTDKRRKDGKQSQCKSCNNAANLRRYANNPDVRLAKKLYDVEYVNKNRVRKYKNNYAWNEANKDVVRERSRLWKSRNKHKVASQTRKRQAAKAQRTPPWLNSEHLKQIEHLYWLASDLRCVSGQTYHVDHIIPLQGRDICGLHVPWNLQILPSDINERKFNNYEQSDASTLSIP